MTDTEMLLLLHEYYPEGKTQSAIPDLWRLADTASMRVNPETNNPGLEYFWQLKPCGSAALMVTLLANGVEARGLWPPIHHQPCFPELDKSEAAYPNASAIFNRGLMLPLFSSMTDDQVSHVIKVANS